MSLSLANAIPTASTVTSNEQRTGKDADGSGGGLFWGLTFCWQNSLTYNF
jgi:hypothetical protein